MHNYIFQSTNEYVILNHRITYDVVQPAMAPFQKNLTTDRNRSSIHLT